MASFAFANQMIMFSFGSLHLVLGLIGSIVQIFILISVPYYRTTPCTFYFIIASIHECGLFITSSGPLVVAAFLNIEMMRISTVWCKLRFFFATSFAAVPLTCACFATIDQYLKTSRNIRFNQLSNIQNAYRACFFVVIIWWLHGSLYIYYQELSPITRVCTYLSNAFFVYAEVFLCAVLCVMHNLIMTLFGIAAYRNMRTITALSRTHADRQLTILVFIQVFLTLIGLSPYGIYIAYEIITIDVQKTADQQNKEALVGNIAYLFGSVTYAGRFYLFLFSSRRFRRLVMNRIFRWRQKRRTGPSPG